MKNVITGATILIASLLVSAAAHAFCTRNPFRMGMDAAKQACDDIAAGYVPQPPEGGGFSTHREAVTPEKTCSASDVIQCKNAMAQYLRRADARGCADLIRRNEPVVRSPGNTAGEVWRNYVLTTCNQ